MTKPVQTRLRNITRQTMIWTQSAIAQSTFRQGGLRLNNLKNVNGTTVTLNKPNGKTGKFRYFIGASLTGGNTTFRGASGLDIISGSANVQTSTFQTAPNTNTVTFNGTTTGGVLGTYVEFEDIGPLQWRVTVLAVGSGTAATPFSNT